jgi:hypothetical protein
MKLVILLALVSIAQAYHCSYGVFGGDAGMHGDILTETQCVCQSPLWQVCQQNDVQPSFGSNIGELPETIPSKMTVIVNQNIDLSKITNYRFDYVDSQYGLKDVYVVFANQNVSYVRFIPACQFGSFTDERNKYYHLINYQTCHRLNNYHVNGWNGVIVQCPKNCMADYLNNRCVSHTPNDIETICGSIDFKCPIGWQTANRCWENPNVPPSCANGYHLMQMNLFTANHTVCGPDWYYTI